MLGLRIALAVAASLVLMSTSADAATAARSSAAAGSDYPWASAPCEFPNGGVSCTNPKNSIDKYDWFWDENNDGKFGAGKTNSGDCGGSRPSTECFDKWGYEYRNCTSYVAWRLSLLGISASLFSSLH